MNVRLLQLVSPALPVGAYSYSQGLEAAVEARAVRDLDTSARWIGDVLELSVASLEAPVFLRLVAAWYAGDTQAAAHWNAEFVAARETAELRAETLQMGFSLRRLLRDLQVPGVEALDGFPVLAFPSAYAFAVAAWEIAPREALIAYLFAWLENQMLAALKCVPLGQTQGQWLLLTLGQRLPAIADRAAALRDDELANFAPGLALASSRHETQYSRLFRS